MNFARSLLLLDVNDHQESAVNIQFTHTQSIASKRWLELVKSARGFLSSGPVRDLVRDSDCELLTLAPAAQSGWKPEKVNLFDGQVFHSYKSMPYLSVTGSADGEGLLLTRDAVSGANLSPRYGGVDIASDLSLAVIPPILLLADHLLPDHLTLHSDGDIEVWLSAKALIGQSLQMTICLPRSLSSEPDVPSFMDYRA